MVVSSLALLAGAFCLQAAGVSGRVTLQGRPPPEVPIQMSAECMAAQKQPPTTRHYRVGVESGLANVMVTIRSGLEGRTFPAPVQPMQLDCVACQIEPYVTAVQVGQPIVFRNDSPFNENLHLTGRINPGFNFGFPRGTRIEKRFSRAEDFIRIKGDVHPWFFGYISVIEHPFFAITDANGSFTLPAGLPDGTYQLEARHLKAGRQVRELVVRNGTAAPITFSLEVPK